MVIDVGAEAIDRPFLQSDGYTVLSLDNPANGPGVIDMIRIFAKQNINKIIVGTFFLVDGTNYQCRDSELIGNVLGGNQHLFSGLDIEIEKGDFIGAWWENGSLAADVTDYAGLMCAAGKHIAPGENVAYELRDGYAVSLYGVG